MSMKLLILGLLMEGDLHPYEIRKIIKARSWDEHFKLRDGSLYYAVDALRAGGLIEPAEIVPAPGEGRPDKVIYRITESGQDAFFQLLYAQFDQESGVPHPFFFALPFVRYADPLRVEALIRKQADASGRRIDRLRSVLELKEPYLPGGPALMIRGMLQFIEAERRWLGDLLDAARSGELFTGPKWSYEEIEAYLSRHTTEM
ncbi:PadR family transcriptional regulator [Paenibacillus xanthanilyticus]|uniref:PadR family transcriptional regulator n=1 Tax=Paenibacillus xanthanilyticus TaxID=1783531 RepID=A0ABV8K056_9BACL